MATQEERRHATRSAIVKAAQRLFGRRGFSGTSIDDIAAGAGVSKGAVYHHVPSKEALFEIVIEAVLADLVRRVHRAALAFDDPLDQIRAGCRELLEACARPAVKRIYIVDGPVVLGWHAWRAVDARHFLSMVEAGLAAAMGAGIIKSQPVKPLAQLVGAAATEAALLAATSGSAGEREEVATVLDSFLLALRIDGGASAPG